MHFNSTNDDTEQNVAIIHVSYIRVFQVRTSAMKKVKETTDPELPDVITLAHLILTVRNKKKNITAYKH